MGLGHVMSLGSLLCGNGEASWEGETERPWELEADPRVHADIHPRTTDAEDSRLPRAAAERLCC